MIFRRKKICIFFIFFLLIPQIFSLGKKDKNDSKETAGSQQEESEIKKDFFKVDFLLDTKKANPKNHLVWSNSSAAYRDYFDALSGASKVHSTKNLREAFFDKSTKSFLIPKGLYALCLFALANPELVSTDGLSVTQEGEKTTITFTHRENSYRIESDEKGEIYIPQGFFIKLKENKSENTAENAENAENADSNSSKKEENDESSPEEKEKSEGSTDGFQKDEPPENISAIYTGKLKAKFSEEGILTLKGKLNLQKREKPKEEISEKENGEDKADEEKSEEAAETAPEENAEKSETGNEQ